jgi:3-oxoacyl-[acyl-carrier protein] reductase
LIGFTKALALEVASRNVTVNAVAPGLIDTDMTRAIAAGAHEEWAARIPLKRLGSPDDVANAVVFLASDEAAYITGTCWRSTAGCTFSSKFEVRSSKSEVRS